MAAFDVDAYLTHEPDFLLLQNGFVTMFQDRGGLTETIDMLTERGYFVVTIGTGAWTCDADLHRDVAAAFDFPDCYGANLNALADCLDDVATYACGSSAEATGTVLVLNDFDKFAHRDAELAHRFLDIFADSSREGLLVGHRMMCLVQSDDPDLTFERVGSTAVGWNRAEWLTASRRPISAENGPARLRGLIRRRPTR